MIRQQARGLFPAEVLKHRTERLALLGQATLQRATGKSEEPCHAGAIEAASAERIAQPGSNRRLYR